MKNNKVKVPAKLALSVVAACLVSFCGLLTETAENIAFPAIMSTFQVSTETVQWLTTANLLVVAMITPLSAFLQRRFQLKQLFIFGTMCFITGTVIAIFSPDFALLLFARLIQGIGTGVGVPIAFCIILEQIPFEKVGTYMGYGALVSAAAPALGPTYGGIVNQTLGWRHIFVILIPILIITLILGIVTIEEKHEPEKVPVDIRGIIYIMLTFLGLVYGFANIGAFQKTPVMVIAAFLIGIAALILFANHCTKCGNPLIDMRIFKNIPFVCHLVAFFLINAIMLGTSFLLPNYLQVALLCESMISGFMLLPGAGLNAVMGPFSGAALDKIGAKLPILTGTVLMTVGIALFAIFGMKLNTGMVIGFYIIFGIGCGIAFGNTMTVGNLRLPVEQKAYGNTCFNTLMQFAGAVGTSVCAALVASSQMQDNSLSHEMKTAAGSTHSFIFLLILALVCLMLQIAGFKKYETAQKE
ncbi:permease of the major facilitator superfamily [Clostridium sp. SY8519]|uniref:MFS transporter n=1 Tax=Clostridium sp. (strain SY8519) TaxID=1042156 RepID=UPI0002171B1B|nr:MFS transporter [Clostridium sp. SY8519]BAK46419.1 permease of the major facilitator superfamily [Clostridium sp. SY8519]